MTSESRLSPPRHVLLPGSLPPSLFLLPCPHCSGVSASSCLGLQAQLLEVLGLPRQWWRQLACTAWIGPQGGAPPKLPCRRHPSRGSCSA